MKKSLMISHFIQIFIRYKLPIRQLTSYLKIPLSDAKFISVINQPALWMERFVNLCDFHQNLPKNMKGRKSEMSIAVCEPPISSGLLLAK